MSFINVFKGSLIISLIIKTVRLFEAAYEESSFKRAALRAGSCFKASKTCGILTKYVCKKPFYKNSFVYRIVMAIAGLFDRLFAFINKAGGCLFSGSRFSSVILGAVKADTSGKLYGFGLLFMSIPIGTLIALILTGNSSLVNMVICWVLFIVGLIMTVIASCPRVFLNSALYKAFRLFFDLIR